MTQLQPGKPLRGVSTTFKSIEELYERYARQAYGLALRVLKDSSSAEEAVQEIFVRYWRQPGLYNPQNGPFLNWLLREVHCYCLDCLPVDLIFSKNSRFTSGPPFTGIIFKKPTPAKEDEIAQQQTKARQALAGLPQEQRAIVELAYFNGLTYQQIAQATGQPVQAVRQNLANGLLRLKRAIS